MSASQDQVGADEWLLRRIQLDHGPTEMQPQPSPQAFRPTKHDHDGLSLYREVLVSAEQLCGRGKSGKEYYVGRVRVRDLQALGMKVEATPDPSGTLGHVIIPELNAHNRKEPLQESWQAELAERCDVVGPFKGEA